VIRLSASWPAARWPLRTGVQAVRAPRPLPHHRPRLERGRRRYPGLADRAGTV